MTQPHEVLYASEQFQEWLMALKRRAMLETHNQSQAMFRAVIQNMRRHMTSSQVLAFADALPPLPRGIFLEGWRPADAVPLASPNELLEEVITGLSPHHMPPDSIVRDVLAVLADRSEPHKARTIRDQLPHVLRPLWPT